MEAARSSQTSALTQPDEVFITKTDIWLVPSMEAWKPIQPVKGK